MSATVTLSDGTVLHLRSSASNKGDVYVPPSGQIVVQFVAMGPHGEIFTLGGPAASGASMTADRVAVSGEGTYFDSTYPGSVRCVTTYSEVSATGVSGTSTCKLLQLKNGTVTVRFDAG